MMHVSFTAEVTLKVIDFVTDYVISTKNTHLGRLASLVESNGGTFDQQQIANTLGLPKANIRRLHDLGIKHHLWDANGQLTEDGRYAAQEKVVHTPEAGPLRIWSFEHPITGVVPVLVERRRMLPGSKESDTSKESYEILVNLRGRGRFLTLMSDGDGNPCFIELTGQQMKKNWVEASSFETSPTLSWIWTHSHAGFEVRPELELSGKLSGLKKEEWTDLDSRAIQYENTIDPNQRFREWLSTGEYASSPWDIEHAGMLRPFSQLTQEEKMRHTIDAIELSGDEIEEWDRIHIRDVPLLAANENDATDWALFLLDQQTPGYTTTERTERILYDILEDDPFRAVSSDKVHERAIGSLASVRAEPRLSKLLRAGDHLDAVALVPATVLAQKRDANVAVHDGGDDYSEFVKQLSHDMKGEISQVVYVDRYTHQTNYRKKLALFAETIRENIPNCQFNLLTAHTPYTEYSENSNSKIDEFRSKLNDFCDNVYFMEEKASKMPHDRSIVIRTDSETRWWSLTVGITAKDRSIPAMRVEEVDVEPVLIQHLNSTQSKIKKEASE